MQTLLVGSSAVRNQKMDFGPTAIPLKFDSDLGHHLGTKNYGFSHLVLLHTTLLEVCALTLFYL